MTGRAFFVSPLIRHRHITDDHVLAGVVVEK
jgi:hypothetical protein